jgi:hypothetical protein
MPRDKDNDMLRWKENDSCFMKGLAKRGRK